MDLTVTYIVKESGTRVNKTFDSDFRCRAFIRKLKHSKKCLLVAYPLFID